MSRARHFVSRGSIKINTAWFRELLHTCITDTVQRNALAGAAAQLMSCFAFFTVSIHEVLVYLTLEAVGDSFCPDVRVCHFWHSTEC